MSLADDLFGSKEKTQGKNYGENTNWTFGRREGYENSNSSLNQISSLLESLTSRGTQRVNKGGKVVRDTMLDLRNRITGTLDKFSPEAAIRDSQASMDAAIASVLNRDLPDVRTGNTVAGGYNATTTRLLQDNVTTQAAAEGAKVRQATIESYGNQSQGFMNQLNALISQALDMDTVASREDSQDSTGTQNTSGTENTNRVNAEESNINEKGTTYGIGSQTTRGRDSALDVTQDLFGGWD